LHRRVHVDALQLRGTEGAHLDSRLDGGASYRPFAQI
jgi:hypothetical protein